MVLGFKYPLALDSNGSLQYSEGVQYIAEQIISYLETERRERLGLPQYGLRDYLFSTPPASMATEIEAGLKLYIPQAVFAVTVEPSDLGEFLVNVYWSYADEDQTPIKVTLTP